MTYRLIFQLLCIVMLSVGSTSCDEREQEATCKHLVTKDHGVIGDMAIDPSNTELAIGTYDGKVRIWDIQSGKRLQKIKSCEPFDWSFDPTVHRAYIEAVAWHKNGKEMFVRISKYDDKDNSKKILQRWNVESGDLLESCNCDFFCFYRCSLNSKGTMYFVGTDAGLEIWNAELEPGKNKKVPLYLDHQNMFKWLDGCIVLICIHRTLPFNQSEKKGPFFATWDSSGLYILTGTNREIVSMWDAESGKCIKQFKGLGYVTHISCDPSGKHVVAEFQKHGHVYSIVWDIQTGRQVCMLGKAYLPLFDSTGQMIIAQNDQGGIDVWTLPQFG